MLPFSTFAPFAIVIGGVGTVLGFFASTLRSKSKRQGEAVSSIRNQLAEQLSANEKNSFRTNTRADGKVLRDNFNLFDDYFRQLSDGLSQIADCLRNTEADLNANANALNKAYASQNSALGNWQGPTGKPRSARLW